MTICLRRREFIAGLSPSLKRAAIMLMKLFPSLLCIFSLLLPWREVTAAELPQKLSSAVRAAEADGLSCSRPADSQGRSTIQLLRMPVAKLPISVNLTMRQWLSHGAEYR